MTRTGRGEVQGEAPPKVVRPPMDPQRAEFLRNCRASIKPSDLGLPEPQRRRTKGLRREDVASLSGVSVAWYTWLEQGRQMRVSDEVLERICHTLRLTEDERVYLFSLVQHRPPRLQHEGQQELPPEILRMIEFAACPSVMLNLRWDVLAWNKLTALVRDYAAMPVGQRNLIEVLFAASPGMKPAEFEATAARCLAKLRVDYSKADKDPQFESLLRRLETQYPVFRRMWRAPEINVRSYGEYCIQNAEFGKLVFENTAFVPDGHPEIRVVMLTPLDDATRKAVEVVRSRLEKTG